MSKQDAPESTENYEFTVPDFDEDAFIHKELTGFQSTAVLFGWGLGLGILSWILALAIGRTDMVWFAGLAFVAISIPLVARVMQRFKIDVDPNDKKGNFGRGFLLFFSWLAFAMLFLNPPISDFVAPEVEIIMTPPVQQLGAPMDLYVFAADNSGSVSVDIEVLQGTTQLLTIADFDHDRDDVWHTSFEATLGGTFQVHVTATDNKGLVTEVTREFSVFSKALDIDVSDLTVVNETQPNKTYVMDGAGDEFIVQYKADEQPRLMALVDPETSDVKVLLNYDADRNLWSAGPSRAGWHDEGTTMTYKVMAQMQNPYHGTQVFAGGLIESNDTFTIAMETTTGDNTVKIDEPLEISPLSRRAPGIESVVLVAGLVGMVAFARRRKEL